MNGTFQEKKDFLCQKYGNKELVTRYILGGEKNTQQKEQEIEAVDCYSAESFVTQTELKGHIAFDMELHSIAIIADIYNIPLIAFKKISDNLSLEKYYETTENKEVMELASCLAFLK